MGLNMEKVFHVIFLIFANWHWMLFLVFLLQVSFKALEKWVSVCLAVVEMFHLHPQMQN